MDIEDLDAAPAVGTINQNLAIEAPRPQQGGIEDFRPVGGRQQDDAAAGIEAVEFGQELIEGLFFGARRPWSSLPGTTGTPGAFVVLTIEVRWGLVSV